MIQTIITTIISFIVSGLLGYCVSLIKNYRGQIIANKEKEQLQNVALRSLLKSQLTNTFFVYNETKSIPDYVYANFLSMLKVYESLGGNGFIHNIAKKMENWEIIKTDIM